MRHGSSRMKLLSLMHEKMCIRDSKQAAPVFAPEKDERKLRDALRLHEREDFKKFVERPEAAGHEYCLLYTSRVGVARARAFDRTRDDLRTAHAQKLFRRRGSDFKFAAIQKRGKRRGRNGAQPFKKFPAGQIILCRQPLRKVDLINVASADVFLRALDF